METFQIQGGRGISATVTNFGARLMSLLVPDKEYNFCDIVLGFKFPSGYLHAEEKYFGATIGRYANRISEGIFSTKKGEHQLDTNLFPHHLHGGKAGFHLKTWEIMSQNDHQVTLSLHSPHGEGGYPGNLHATTRYEITPRGSLLISYTARADRPCPVNLSHHSYFNLGGHDSGSILQHRLLIPASHYTPVDDTLIPTGEIAPVQGTPFDFREATAIGDRIRQAHPQLLLGKGYDHNYVLKRRNSPDLLLAAEVSDPASGRRMRVFTDQPGMQLYTANWLSGKDIGKSGTPYTAYSAFCLETQHFPDSPNQAHFPSCILRPGEVYRQCSEYRFDTL